MWTPAARRAEVLACHSGTLTIVLEKEEGGHAPPSQAQLCSSADL